MMKKTTHFLTSMLIYSFVFTSIAFGQSNEKHLVKNETHLSDTFQNSRYLVNYTEPATNGLISPAVGLESDLDKVINALSDGAKNNPVLIDEFSGKSRMILGNLANALLAGNAPQNLKGKTVLGIDWEAVYADAKQQPQAEELILNLINQLNSSKGNYILFLEDLSVFNKEFPQFGEKVANVLRESVEKGKLQILSTATSESYNLHIAKDSRLKNRFQKIFLIENADEDGFVGDKLSPDLRELVGNSDPNKKVKIILQADDIKNPELKRILELNNVTIENRAENLNMLILELPVGAAEQIAAFRGSKHLSLDKEMASFGHLDTTTGYKAMRAVSGNNGLDGRGIGIAIVDSGVFRDHASFLYGDDSVRISANIDFTGEGTTNYDRFGHGTHVSGIAVGGSGEEGEMSNYKGIAPRANIINVRVLGSQGTGSTANLIAAVDWMFANRSRYNIKVVNLSLGTPAIETWRNDPLCRAVRKLTAAGIVVVAAAGNTGRDNSGNKLYGAIHSPGNDPSVITVGASNTFGTDSRTDDAITTFSSRGPTRSFYTDSDGIKRYDHLIKPDLVAPGNKIISSADRYSLLYTLNPSLRAGGSSETAKMYLSGTSMATPAVAGTVALMMQANPKLTPNMVKMILMYTAQPLAGFNHLEQGAGQLNVEGAVRLAKLVRQDLPADTPVGTPMLTTTQMPTPSSVIASQTIRWSQGIILDKGYVMSNQLITKYQKVYDLGMLLSDGLLMSDGMLVSDGLLMSDGMLISDGLLMSDGMLISDGTPFLDWSSTFGSGLLMSDGMLISDGMLVSDGMLISDGMLLSDSVFGSNSPLVSGDDTAAMR